MRRVGEIFKSRPASALDKIVPLAKTLNPPSHGSQTQEWGWYLSTVCVKWPEMKALLLSSQDLACKGEQAGVCSPGGETDHRKPCASGHNQSAPEPCALLLPRHPPVCLSATHWNWRASPARPSPAAMRERQRDAPLSSHLAGSSSKDETKEERPTFCFSLVFSSRPRAKKPARMLRDLMGRGQSLA